MNDGQELTNVNKLETHIVRRLLINLRVDPDAVVQYLPVGLVPDVVEGHALVGICAISLKSIRPTGLPARFGVSTDNVAQRIAARDATTGERGVFVARRDTGSRLAAFASTALFPTPLGRASVSVTDVDGEIRLVSRPRRPGADLDVVARPATGFPVESVFGDTAAAADWLRTAAVGWTIERGRVDAVTLGTGAWDPIPLVVDVLQSRWLEDRFGSSAMFDHAIAIRDLRAQWRSTPTSANYAA